MYYWALGMMVMVHVVDSCWNVSSTVVKKKEECLNMMARFVVDTVELID